MSLFVLDTDTLSLLQRGHPAVCARVAGQQQTDLAVTVITVEEQLTGWYTLVRQARRRDQLVVAYASLADSVTTLSGWAILPLTEPALDRFDQLRALRLNVGANDLRIAAIALEHGAAVVTRNLRDFGRVPGLVCEDWSV